MQRQSRAGNFTEKQEAVMEKKKKTSYRNIQQLHLNAMSLKTAMFALFFFFYSLTSTSLFCTMRISIQMSEENF